MKISCDVLMVSFLEKNRESRVASTLRICYNELPKAQSFDSQILLSDRPFEEEGYGSQRHLYRYQESDCPSR